MVSNDAGIDDPNTGMSVNTYFNGTHSPLDGLGMRSPHRAVGGDEFLVIDTLYDHLPQWDYAVILCNTTELGGGTSLVLKMAFVTRHEVWPDNIMHELGHLLFNLGDEYEYQFSCEQDNIDQSRAPAGEPMFPNITATRDPARLKWRDLVPPDVAIPTMENPDCSRCDERPNVLDVRGAGDLARSLRNFWLRLRRLFGRWFGWLVPRFRRWLFEPDEADPDETKVGLFEGANYFKCGNYRPAYRCKMCDQSRHTVPFVCVKS